LRKIRVDDQSALAVVGGREVAADLIELGLNLLVSRIVGDVGLDDLNDELANRADALLDFALDIDRHL